MFDVLFPVEDLPDLLDLFVLLGLEVFSLDGVALLSFGGTDLLGRAVRKLRRRDVSLFGFLEGLGVAVVREFEGLFGRAHLVQGRRLGGRLEGVLFVLVLAEQTLQFLSEGAGLGDARSGRAGQRGGRRGLGGLVAQLGLVDLVFLFFE